MKIKMTVRYGLWKKAELEIEFEKAEDLEKILKNVKWDFNIG